MYVPQKLKQARKVNGRSSRNQSVSSQFGVLRTRTNLAEGTISPARKDHGDLKAPAEGLIEEEPRLKL